MCQTYFAKQDIFLSGKSGLFLKENNEPLDLQEDLT